MAYHKLVNILTKTCKNNQVPNGMGGMWTPDNIIDNGDLIYTTYASGYQHTLYSRKFKFELAENYTDANGVQVQLKLGTLDMVQAALDFYEIVYGKELTSIN